ncbi:MAG: tyrosine-type recombinase/integrase [Bacteroidota bacterium]
MDLTAYSYTPGTHRGKKVILIHFAFDLEKKQALRKRFPSAKWSQTKKAWYLPDLPTLRKILGLSPKHKHDQKLEALAPVNREAYAQMAGQLDLKAYSENTKRMYLAEFYHLLALLKDRPVAQLSPERVKAYFLYCLNVEKMRERKLNGKINAVKFYFEQVLHRPKMFFDIPRPKKPINLPKVLSRAEIKRLFAQVSNEKHLLALKLCYGMGLRVSELVRLTIQDIDSDRMLVRIAEAKGKKDRYVPLPKSILPFLRIYYKKYRPKEYLLQGQYGGAYSKSAVQQVFKRAMRRARIYKKIGVHGLRHSYATHLLESGADIRFIQELLGHNSVKTTQIYTKVTSHGLSKITSPLDTL